MLQIRFPHQFEEAYAAKYGGARSLYPSFLPPSVQFSYPLAEDEVRRKNQLYHAELMAANRKQVEDTIRSKAGFQHKYPCYPTRPANPLPHKHIISGSRASLDSISQPSFGYVGSLSTFPSHSLTGGVLRDYGHARKILDRRANQVRQQEDPMFIPQGEVITREDQLKLDFSSLLNEVGDAIASGSFSDLVYSALRRLTGAFIRTMPLIEDPDDVAEIKRTVDNILRNAEVSDRPAQHRAPIGVAHESLDPVMNARRARITAVLEKVEEFLSLYMAVFERGTTTEKERALASKAFAKKVGLFSFADFTTSLGLVGEQQEVPSTASVVAPLLPQPPDASQLPNPEGAEELALDEGGENPEAAGQSDYVNVTLNNQQLTIPQKLSVLLAMPKDQLIRLATALKTPRKTISDANNASHLRQYIIQRASGLFGPFGFAWVNDVGR